MRGLTTVWVCALQSSLLSLSLSTGLLFTRSYLSYPPLFSFVSSSKASLPLVQLQFLLLLLMLSVLVPLPWHTQGRSYTSQPDDSSERGTTEARLMNRSVTLLLLLLQRERGARGGRGGEDEMRFLISSEREKCQRNNQLEKRGLEECWRITVERRGARFSIMRVKSKIWQCVESSYHEEERMDSSSDLSPSERRRRGRRMIENSRRTRRGGGPFLVVKRLPLQRSFVPFESSLFLFFLYA